jgi:hypothetical protein
MLVAAELGKSREELGESRYAKALLRMVEASGQWDTYVELWRASGTPIPERPSRTAGRPPRARRKKPLK